MDNGLLQVAGRDAFAVALAGLFGGLVAQRNHKQLERLRNDDGCNLDGGWLVLSTQLEKDGGKREKKEKKGKRGKGIKRKEGGSKNKPAQPFPRLHRPA